MFPVGEALMLSPGGNAVQSHFPFICCMSFNVYNHLQSHRVLPAVRGLHLETDDVIRAASKFDLNLVKQIFPSVLFMSESTSSFTETETQWLVCIHAYVWLWYTVVIPLAHRGLNHYSLNKKHT